MDAAHNHVRAVTNLWAVIREKDGRRKLWNYIGFPTFRAGKTIYCIG